MDYTTRAPSWLNEERVLSPEGDNSDPSRLAGDRGSAPRQSESKSDALLIRLVANIRGVPIQHNDIHPSII